MYWALSPQGYEVGHLSLSSAKVKNDGHCMSTPPYMPSLYGQEQLLLLYIVVCQRLCKMQTSKEIFIQLTNLMHNSFIL